MWTQVCEPLPCQSVDSNESQYQVTDTVPNSLTDDAVSKPVPGPSTNSKDQDTLLTTGALIKRWPPLNHDCDRCPRHISVRRGTSPVGRELSHQPEAIQSTEAKTPESTRYR